MRKFKTAEDNRTNYIYYTAEGKKIVIQPGMTDADGNAVTEEMITILHGMDDDEVDADRREEYKCLTDEGSDPMEQMIASIDAQAHEDRLDKLKTALAALTDLQKATIYKKFYQNMSNTDIAAEEGVSEAAIRNRLKKIYANLAKKI